MPPELPASGVFVTGTDTGVGKTRVAVALVQALRAAGVAAVGMKPIASGCVETACGLRNEDAESLRLASDIAASDYALVNPFALPEAIAPHLAARAAGLRVDLAALRDSYAAISKRAEFVVVEGVGGWLVPLADDLMQSDLVLTLGLPALLVVGVKLGCINHALLSARAIAADGVPFLGWIANVLDPDLPRIDQAIAAMAERIGCAPVARIEHHGAPDATRGALASLVQRLGKGDGGSQAAP